MHINHEKSNDKLKKRESNKEHNDKLKKRKDKNNRGKFEIMLI